MPAVAGTIRLHSSDRANQSRFAVLHALRSGRIEPLLVGACPVARLGFGPSDLPYSLGQANRVALARAAAASASTPDSFWDCIYVAWR